MDYTVNAHFTNTSNEQASVTGTFTVDTATQQVTAEALTATFPSASFFTGFTIDPLTVSFTDVSDTNEFAADILFEALSVLNLPSNAVIAFDLYFPFDPRTNTSSGTFSPDNNTDIELVPFGVQRVIVGLDRTADNAITARERTTVPEPEVISLLAVSLLSLVAMRRKAALL